MSRDVGTEEAMKECLYLTKINVGSLSCFNFTYVHYHILLSHVPGKAASPLYLCTHVRKSGFSDAFFMLKGTGAEIKGPACTM